MTTTRTHHLSYVYNRLFLNQLNCSKATKAKYNQIGARKDDYEVDSIVVFFIVEAGAHFNRFSIMVRGGKERWLGGVPQFSLVLGGFWVAVGGSAGDDFYAFVAFSDSDFWPYQFLLAPTKIYRGGQLFVCAWKDLGSSPRASGAHPNPNSQ